jgi:hypothetical protein
MAFGGIAPFPLYECERMRREVDDLVRSISSGEAGIYDTRTEVKVSREEIQRIKAKLRRLDMVDRIYTPINNTEELNLVRGWLASPAPVVSPLRDTGAHLESLPTYDPTTQRVVELEEYDDLRRGVTDDGICLSVYYAARDTIAEGEAICRAVLEECADAGSPSLGLLERLRSWLASPATPEKESENNG